MTSKPPAANGPRTARGPWSPCPKPCQKRLQFPWRQVRGWVVGAGARKGMEGDRQALAEFFQVRDPNHQVLTHQNSMRKN